MIKDFLNFLKQFSKKYFISGLYLNTPRGVTVLVQITTLPIVLANLRLTDYGLFQLILAIQVWLNVFTANQMTGGSIRGIARDLNGTLFFVFFARLKFFIPIITCGLIASLFIYQAGLTTFSLLLLLMLIFLITGFLPLTSIRQFFFAKKQFKQFAFWESLIIAISTIGATLAVFLTQSILIFAMTRFGLVVLISLIGFFYISLKYKLFSAYKQGSIDKEVFSYGVKMIPANFVLASANKAPEFIIAAFSGTGNLAIFSVAARIEGVLRNFFSSSTHTLFFADFAKISQSSAIKKINAKLKQGLILTTLMSVFFVLLGYIYIALFLPQDYQMAKIYLLILGLSLPLLALQGIMQAILEVNFRYKELTALFILPNLLKLVLVISLGIRGGLIGVCWGIVLGSWANFIFYYFFTLKRNLAIRLINKFSLLRKLSNF